MYVETASNYSCKQLWEENLNLQLFSSDYVTGCLLRGVPEVLSNISLVFGDRDLVFYMKMLYYGTFDNQKMIWPISPTRYFKWLCQKSLKIYTIFTNSSLSSMFFKNFNFEAFRGIFWPWWRKQKSLRIKFYPRKHPFLSILGPFGVIEICIS